MGDHYMLRRLIMGIALLAILPAIIFIFIWSAGGSKVMSPELQQKTMQEYTEKLNQRNADIIFYQKDPIGPANLKARRVNALNDQGLALNLFSDKAFHVIILDDLDGSLVLKDQDIQKLKDLLINKAFRIIYLGSAKYKKLVSEGIFLSNMSHKEGTKSYITFYNRSHIHSCMEGFADDPVSMPLTGLDDEKTVVYTAVMALSKDELYWS